MGQRILDTSILIAHWRRCAQGGLRERNRADATAWARQLIETRKSNLIATPVEIEFLAGVQSSHELELARVFLGEFDVVDKRDIPKKDWEDAQRIAQRVPQNGSPRDLGACLIRAIANRLRYEVDTLDAQFPSR